MQQIERKQESISTSHLFIRPKIIVSPFHFIIWIFLLDKQISSEQKERIKNMYGVRNKFNCTPNFTWGSWGFDQAVKSIQASNNRSVIKVVTNKSMVAHVFNKLKENQNQIIQVLVYSNNASSLIFQGNFTEQISMLSDLKDIYSGQIFDLDQKIQIAEREVQKYTKSFRTFNNAQLLLPNQVVKINKYRYKLVSFIKLKVSDYETFVDKFKNFANEQLQELKNMQYTQHISVGHKFYKYLQDSKEFMKDEYKMAKEKVQKNKDNIMIENLKNLQKKQQQSRIKFYANIISLYKQQELFYHLLNTNLRGLNEGLLLHWEVLAIPFYHLYSAIKYLYKKRVKDEVEGKFYTSNFTVYRGGRIRKNEFQIYEKYQSKIFIEFFGFTSTTLNLQIAIDKFIMAKNLRDMYKDIDEDENCIFKIQAKFNEIMVQQKYDFLVHGFYKFDNLIQNGESQKEVLFGPLNIFQLVKVQKKTIKSLLQQQKQPYREQYGNDQIVVVYLKFGSFFDILLDDNDFNLSEEQKMAKENYIFCMNSINKYDKFDFADFYQLNKQPLEAYKYLEKKVKAEKEQDKFLISTMDNKNYFARMSQVCLKQGKNKQALHFNKISIKYYEQLESINLKSIYNLHYQNLFRMKTKIIQFYQENSNYIAADLQFQRQLQFIQSKQFKEPSGKLRRSQIIINQGVNKFSIGKIKQTIGRFKDCQKQIKQISKQIANNLKIQKNCFVQYIKNIFCCGSGDIIWSCCRFLDYFNKQKQQSINKLKKNRKNIVSTESKIEELLIIARDALSMMIKVFKKPEQYQDLIQRYNQQITSQISKRKENMNSEQTLEDQLRQIRQNVSNTNISDPQYDKQFNILCTKFKQLKNPHNLRLYTENLEIDAFQTKYINQFIKREKDRRIKYEEQKKEEILRRNQKELIQFYIKCLSQIDEELTNLAYENYDQSTTLFLKQLNKRARINLMSHDYASALRDIQKIQEQKRQDCQDRNNQLAMAYMTKTKILLHSEKYEQAVESVDFALQQYEKSVKNVGENENSQEKEMDNTQGLQILKKRNEYLELKIMRAKSLLYYIHDKNQKKHIRISTIHESRFNIRSSYQQWNPSDFLSQVFKIVTYLKQAITQRNSLQNISQIQADFKQMTAIYYLILNKPNTIDDAFTTLDECFNLRKKLIGLNNSLNSITCCEIIFKFYNNKHIYAKIKKHQYLTIIDQAFKDFKNCHFYWKVAKAYYLIKIQEQKGQAIQYLKTAIRSLKKQKDNYLVKQRQSLQKELDLLECNQSFAERDLLKKNQPSTAIPPTYIQKYEMDSKSHLQKSKGLTNSSFDFQQQKFSSEILKKETHGETQKNMKKKEKKEKKEMNLSCSLIFQQCPSRQQIFPSQHQHITIRNKKKYLPKINP